MARPVKAGRNDTVVAAGAVVWRPGNGHDGGIEICVVHRPRYDDWSLPKGKLDGREHVLATAVREVEEETGHRVVLGRPLPTQHYEANGLPKRVHYWAARADDRAAPWEGTDEVDEIAFLPAADAIRRLTHARDAEPVSALVAGPVRTTPLVVFRHTKAVARTAWDGPDKERPLTSRGAAQAVALAPAFAALGLARVVTSDALRCVDSVRPYAEQAGLTVDTEPALSEIGHLSQPGNAGKLVRSLLADGEPTLVCSHRPVLPDIVAAATEQVQTDVPSKPFRAGEFLVLHHRGGVVVAAQRFPLP
ncbi:MAG: NUDIX hydrolase [Jiangellaceae bacterium]